MITTECWHHRGRGFCVSIAPGLLHVHGFGWSWELEWGEVDKGAGWVRRLRMREAEEAKTNRLPRGAA